MTGPVQVTLTVRRGLPSLRAPRAYRVLQQAFQACSHEGFALCRYDVRQDRLHLVVDVSDTVALSRGMQGLAIRVAKALNRHWRHRKGSVFAERFLARAPLTRASARRMRA